MADVTEMHAQLYGCEHEQDYVSRDDDGISVLSQQW